VVNTTSTLPPAVNTTDHDGYCFYSCPFNNMSSSEYIEIEVGTIQPCVYTVQATMVFKGNYTVSCFLFLETMHYFFTPYCCVVSNCTIFAWNKRKRYCVQISL